MPIANPDSEARRQRAYRRLGTDNPVCVGCGERDPHCFERHHIAGQKHHDQTALVCINCHRKLSDKQKDHPADLPGQDSRLATIGHYVLGLADLLVMIAKALAEFGSWLIGEAQKVPAIAGGHA